MTKNTRLTLAEAYSPRRALVVDDESLVRASVRTSLELLFDYEVVEAESALKAIQEISSSRYDLVVCDLFMKTDNGLDVLRHLRRRSQTCAFILFTGSREQLGADDQARITVVDKPDFTGLIHTVSTLSQ